VNFLVNPTTPQELIAQFPDIENDLAYVAEWMADAPTELTFAIEPLEKYTKEIQDRLGTYDDSPRHASRTNTIVELLRAGAPQRPVFIDTEYGMLIEGNHRIVAFYLLGLTSLPVVYVTAIARATKAA